MNWIEYKYDRATIFGERATTTDYGSDTLETVRKAFKLFHRDNFAVLTIPNFRGFSSVTFRWYDNDKNTETVVLELKGRENEPSREYEMVSFLCLKKEVYKLYDKSTGQRIKERG